MPFKSEKQRKWMWANEPEMAEKWADEEDEVKEESTRVSNRQLKQIIREESEPWVSVSAEAAEYGRGYNDGYTGVDEEEGAGALYYRGYKDGTIASEKEGVLRDFGF